MLSKIKSANYSLILVAIAWSLLLCGGLAQLGCAKEDAPRSHAVLRLIAFVMLIFSIFGFVGTLGLALYGFSAAKLRAGLAITAALGPVIWFLTK